jgi:tetratricopeptide (TPR) repeat protein
MHEYLYTARTPEGRRVTECMEADSADEVVRLLGERGYTEIVLHTDDIMARYTRYRQVQGPITPRDYVGFRRSKGYLSRVLFLARKLYAGAWMPSLLAISVIVSRRIQGLPWDYWDTGAAVVLAAPLAYVLIAALFSTAERYSRLLDAASWFRWEEVLELLPSLRHRLPPEEAAVREAQAVAGLGRLEEGLELVRPFGDGKRLPLWMYYARLANVYFAAGRQEQVLAVTEKAAELAPDNPALLIDLATLLIRYRRDLRRAEELLARAQKHAISDMVGIFLENVQGMLALEQGDAQKALHLLSKSQAAMMPYRHATPIINYPIDRTHAYLALVHASLGEPTEAERHYRLAQPRLLVTDGDDLLRRCEQALGLPMG